ncbi:hypothetical protein LAZ67_10000705 [Cordylochernes scorpioides]|uniref:Retrotransposon gag domain-containing protein n=1 Tax=Cordylochernes scorpioides TaxID=51811 RepID=A0ABY6KZ00_9ARAC|nr:hypothetical protein LAZ67_10000705 [Cordylochernes scorpioides]
MDETWAHHFTPESKQQSMQWRHFGSPPPKKAKTVPISREGYEPFKNTIQRRNAFFTCVQKERQGIMEFVTELKHLAQECEFENLTESLIRDRLIIGILDREMKGKLLEDPQFTLPRAISIGYDFRVNMLTSSIVE